MLADLAALMLLHGLPQHRQAQAHALALAANATSCGETQPVLLCSLSLTGVSHWVTIYYFFLQCL